MSTLSELFKEVYVDSPNESEPSLNPSKSLSWYMDSTNDIYYKNKLMKMYKIKYQKYGMAHNFDSWSWGYPTESTVNEIEFNKISSSSSYRILSTVKLKKKYHNAIVKKISPKGTTYTVSEKDLFWHLGRQKKLKKASPIWLFK